jgi:hypothetical protein
MPTKKKATEKPVAKKKTVTKKTNKAIKGDKYVCNVCGLVVAVDKVCDCVHACKILCCNKIMKTQKKTTTK